MFGSMAVDAPLNSFVGSATQAVTTNVDDQPVQQVEEQHKCHKFKNSDPVMFEQEFGGDMEACYKSVN
jgi:hypothetical protein